jgi:hypothetical protein
MLRTILKGNVLSYFEHHLRKLLHAEGAKHVDNDLSELIMHDMGIQYIPKTAIQIQKYYMRRCLILGKNVSAQNLVKRLNEINRYLLYFSEENPKQLGQNEIIEIFDQAKAHE